MLGVPAGDPKKTDVVVTREQLETVQKFKGERECFAAHLLTVLGPCPAPAWHVREPSRAQHASYLSISVSDTMLFCLSPAMQPESAYKCGVQICFTVVLLLVGLNKP